MSAEHPRGFMERIMAWLASPWQSFVRGVEQQSRRDRRRGADAFPTMWDSGFGVVDGTPFIQSPQSPDGEPPDA